MIICIRSDISPQFYITTLIVHSVKFSCTCDNSNINVNFVRKSYIIGQSPGLKNPDEHYLCKNRPEMKVNDNARLPDRCEK